MARAELYGPGCSGRPWASVEVPAEVLAGGTITFRYGDADSAAALVRLPREAVRELEAWPTDVAVFVNGERVAFWPLPRVEKRERVRLLPGDTLNVQV